MIEDDDVTATRDIVREIHERLQRGEPVTQDLLARISEYLLSRRAPITVGFPELGERGSHLAIIPARFRRCRRLFRPIYERQQRAIARLPVQTITLTPRDIEGECEE